MAESPIDDIMEVPFLSWPPAGPSVPSQPLTPSSGEWGMDLPPVDNSLSAFEAAIPTPPSSDMSPSQLFSVPPPDSYENLFPSGWEALSVAQSLYASPAVDPVAHIKKMLAIVEPTPVAAPQEEINVQTIALRPEPVHIPRNKHRTGPSDATNKRKRSGPAPNVLAERRRKHNEVEIKRRERINEHFSELQQLVQYSKKEKDKDSILRSVIDKLTEYRMRVHFLEAEREQKQSSLPSSLTSAVSAPRMQEIVTSIYQEIHPALANFRALFPLSSVPMAIGAVSGKLIDCNQPLLDALRYTKEEILSLTCLSLTHPEDLPHIFHRFQQMLDGKISSFSIRKRMLNRDGAYVAFRSTSWLVKEANVAKYFFCICAPVGLNDTIEPTVIQM